MLHSESPAAQKLFKSRRVINEDNIEQLYHRMKMMLLNRQLVVVKHSYADTDQSSVETNMGVVIRPERYGNDPEPTPIRLYRKGEPWGALPGLVERSFIIFSLGGYSYSWDAAPSGTLDHYYRKDDSADDLSFHHATVELRQVDGRYFLEFIHRAPAGKGYLHKYQFHPITQSEMEQVSDFRDLGPKPCGEIKLSPMTPCAIGLEHTLPLSIPEHFYMPVVPLEFQQKFDLLGISFTEEQIRDLKMNSASYPEYIKNLEKEIIERLPSIPKPWSPPTPESAREEPQCGGEAEPPAH